jgi:low affinity Fe/Cu permease
MSERQIAGSAQSKVSLQSDASEQLTIFDFPRKRAYSVPGALVINTVTTIVTFLLVALLQNPDLRCGRLSSGILHTSQGGCRGPHCD